jgi:P pilus assembly chaperone PapD
MITRPADQPSIRRSFSILAILAGALWLMSSVAAHAAFDVQPLRVTLDIGKGQTASGISVNNTGDADLPFEVRVERRIIDENGQQTFEPVEDDFIVFPPQGLIPAGGTQAVRFQYLGEIELSQSQGYVLRVSEVPVRDPNFSGIQFAYSFGAAIYVKPSDVSDRIEVRSFEREGNTIRAVLENTGNDFSLLTAKPMRITVGGQTLSFTRQELATIIPNPLIAPGARRNLDMVIETLPEGQLESLRFE